MAGVLVTLAVPRASGFPSASLAPIASSPISQLSLRRSFLPESRASKLNINSFRSSGSVKLRSKFGRRGGRIVCEAQDTAVQGLSVQDLKDAADFLLDSSTIGNHITHYKKYRRDVTLNLKEMFDELVNLYTAQIKSQRHQFHRLLDSFTTRARTAEISEHATRSTEIYEHAARVYISHWIHDLYCVNREATRVISPSAFNDFYSHERVPYSDTYDAFLVLLSASIRPTHVQSIPEDGLYIPNFGQTLDWTGFPLNPFNLEDADHDLFYGLLGIMKERKEWKTPKVMTNSIGRPCWLFDWHENTQVCAWFPRELNYTDSDVALAYIIGTACTPKLGQVDADDWIIADVPQHIEAIKRAIPQRFFGSYEVRTVATPATTEETALPIALRNQIPTTEKYKIMDWTYYSRIILNVEWHTRTRAHRMINLS